MAWTLVGRASITAFDLTVEVGTVTLPASGALEVRIKQISPAETSVFRSGLVYVRTTGGGRELGSKRFWGHLEGEDYVLGSAGQVDVGGEGVLVLEPRRINLRALKSPSLSPWVLDVWVRPLALATGGGGTTPTPTPEPTPTPSNGEIVAVTPVGSNFSSRTTFYPHQSNTYTPPCLAYDWNTETYSGGGWYVTTFNPPITGVTRFEVVVLFHPSFPPIARVNGVLMNTAAKDDWQDFTSVCGATLNKLEWGNSGDPNMMHIDYAHIRAVRINGVMLCDDAVTLTVNSAVDLSGFAPGDVVLQDDSSASGIVAQVDDTAKTLHLAYATGTWGPANAGRFPVKATQRSVRSYFRR